MRRDHRRARLAILLLASLALAGCTDADSAAAPAGPAIEQELPTPPEDAVAVDPGVGAHAHDLWEGRERITIFDDDVVVEAPDVVVWGVMSTRIFREPSFGGAFIDLPEGALVQEGTGRVEMVATWTDTTITGLRFLHRDAGSGEVKPWIEAPSGETIALEVSPEMTDMPHAQVSRWGFLFAASGTPAIAAGTFHLRIDIVKTRDVAEWPPHPDHWNGATELTLADADGVTTQRAGPEELEDPWAEPQDAIPSSAIVPMEAARLRAVVTLASAPGPASGSVHLLSRTASDVSFDFDDVGEPAEVSADGLTWTWELPIEMEQTDNPYATTSAWAFRVVVSPDAPDAPLCDDGCVASEMQYHLTASVHRDAE